MILKRLFFMALLMVSVFVSGCGPSAEQAATMTAAARTATPIPAASPFPPTATPTVIPPTASSAVVPPTATATPVPPTPTRGHREISIAYVADPNAEFPDAELVRSFQASIDKVLADRDIAVTWVTTDPNAESLRALQANPHEYDIVVLAMGQPPADVSSMLRGWLQEGGIIWAFDNGSFSTWRNKELFGGLMPGADKEWEPPEDMQVMVRGLDVLPYDEGHAVANGVEGAIFVAGYPTVMFDPNTNDFFSFLTRFDRALDKTTVPLLKAQEVGEAVIGSQTPVPLDWVVVGFAKKVGEGQAVITPFLGLDDAAAQRFQDNLIEWCLAQVGK